MAIKFFCVHCGKEYRVKDEAAGKKGECTECGSVIEVPAAPEPEDDPKDRRGKITSINDDSVTRADRIFMALGTLGLTAQATIIVGSFIGLCLIGLPPDRGTVDVCGLLGLGLVIIYGLSGVIRGRLCLFSRKKVVTGAKARLGGVVTIFALFVAFRLLALFIDAQLLPKDSVIRHYNQGIEFAQQGYLDDAIGEFERAVRLAPHFAEGYEALARAWAQKGRYETAWTYIERCRAAGGNPDAQFVEDLRLLLGK